VLFRGSDAVNLGDVAGRQLLDAAVVSNDLVIDKLASLLCERDASNQRFCFLKLPELGQDVDLLYCDRE
jgi:hypothetical protein